MDLLSQVDDIPDEILAAVAPHLNLARERKSFFDAESVRDFLYYVAIETRKFARRMEKLEAERVRQLDETPQDELG